MRLAIQPKASNLPRGTTWARGALVASLVVVLGCGLYLAMVSERSEIAPPRTYMLQTLVVFTLLVGLGALIWRERPGHVIAVLFALSAAPIGLLGVTTALWHYTSSHPSRLSLLSADVGKTVAAVAYLPSVFIPLFLIPLFFPDGRLLSRRWRPLVAFIVFVIVTGILDVALRPWPYPEEGIFETRNWQGIEAAGSVFDFGRDYAPLVSATIPPLVLLAVILRYRRSTGLERQQMKWPLGAVLLIVTAISVYFTVPGLMDADARAGYPYVWTVTMLFPLSIAAAIVQHRLWDIDVVINRTIVYGLLSALVVALYLGLITAMGTLFQNPNNTLGGLLATGIAALLFQPARDRLQRGVDRLLYGSRDDPVAVLTRLVEELEGAESPDAILPNLVRTIARTLKIPYVAIWLADASGPMQLAASWGRLPAQVLTVPLRYGQETLGRLVVSPRNGQARFDDDEATLLATIASLAAPTVRAVQLSDEVSRSRRRIVTAREDERRRLRRDLHDGIGPQLASQTLGLEAVSQLMRADPERAATLLESLKTQAEEATVDLRRVVYDLRPPALDDLGLLGALGQVVDRYHAAGLALHLDLPPDEPRWPAAVETALYHLTHEALTNVVRHAGASRCDVRLEAGDGRVTLEVRDDGCGLPPDHRPGVGLQAMRERTAELGGELLLAPLPDGGTLVRASIPLAVSHA